MNINRFIFIFELFYKSECISRGLTTAFRMLLEALWYNNTVSFSPQSTYSALLWTWQMQQLKNSNLSAETKRDKC